MPLRRGARPEANDLAQWSIEASETVNALSVGQSDNVFKGTLRANQTTSTFTDPRIKFGSAVIPVPQTANAAGALSGLYPSAIENGEVTFTHGSSAAADKTFFFVIVGGTTPPTRTAS
jgi:hypothetical protein